MDIYKCPKSISLFTFGKKYYKKVYGQKGAANRSLFYVVVTEIITEYMRAYMVTNI